jgi:phosphatidylserine/phosphatidylglycerophosphate/cardiolipin synthase-like enzyme
LLVCIGSGLAYAGVLGSTDFKTEQDGVELLWSEDYVPRTLELIASAKKSVWVGMYVTSYQSDRGYAIENKMLKALVEAHRSGIDVRVVVDEGYQWDTKTHRMSSRRSKKNDNAVAYLHQNGVEVRRDDPDRIMHGKFMVVDEDIAVIGSHNWTYSALKKNVEVSVLLKGQDDVEELSRHYQTLWKRSRSL